MFMRSPRSNTSEEANACRKCLRDEGLEQCNAHSALGGIGGEDEEPSGRALTNP